jgi:hypothetical protein
LLGLAHALARNQGPFAAKSNAQNVFLEQLKVAVSRRERADEIEHY